MRTPSLDSCVSLAAVLSSKYRTYSPFNESSDSLNSHLNENGILLSMCDIHLPVVGIRCGLSPTSKSWSSSWIQEKETGFRVFAISDNYSVGKILDPTKVEINCLYPTDASSSFRDDHGCGPLSNDPQHGSRGTNRYYRMFEQWYLTQIKNQQFGSDTPWTNISCSDYTFEGDLGQNVTIVRYNNNNKRQERDGSVSWKRRSSPGSVSYEAFSAYSARIWGEIMTHPICDTNSTNDKPNLTRDHWLLYQDGFWWEPQAWDSVLSLMKTIRTSHPDVRLWNELVLSKPKRQEDAVQAVFYLIKPHMSSKNLQKAYLAAKKQATKWKKPLLKVDLTGAADVFACNQSATVQAESYNGLGGGTDFSR